MSNDQEQKPNGDKKRPYQRPEVKEVKMVVEEALAPGCKTPASLGPTGANPCLAPQCFAPGS